MVVFKLDRLARSLSLLLEIEKTLNGHGITLIEMKNRWILHPTAKMIFHCLGWLQNGKGNIVELHTMENSKDTKKDVVAATPLWRRS